MYTKFPGLTATLAIAVISLAYAIMPVQADPPPHSHGGGGGGGDKAKATFSVELFGLVTGVNLIPWPQGSSRNFGDSHPGELAGTLDLSLFYMNDAVSAKLNGDGATCFFDTTHIRDAGVSQIKHGDAEVAFWFNGKTNNGQDDPVYILWMRGELPATWLPTSDVEIVLTRWEMNVANGQSELEPFGCTGEGEFDSFQSIYITPNP